MRFVELFAGIGGLGLGLKRAGMELQFAYEKAEDAIDVFAYNQTVDEWNYRQIDVSDVARTASNILANDPDIVVGGPPCQDFSSAGNGIAGENAALTVTYAMIIAIARPEWFMFENVDRAPCSKQYQQARRIWKRAGYGLTETYVKASHYGVPQARKRFIVIGRLEEADGFLESAISDAADKHPMPVRRILKPDLFEEDLKLLRAGFYSVRPYKGGQAVYGLDTPSPTIIRTSTDNLTSADREIPSPKNAAPIDQAIPLTDHQAMRIQGFPGDWEMGGYRLRERGKPWPQRNVMQMIANAVPPPLAERLGHCIIERDAGISIPALDPQFEKWLKSKKKLKPANIANIKARVNRGRRLLDGRRYADIAVELAALEKVRFFAKLDARTKSDIRAALRLYAEMPRKPSKFYRPEEKRRDYFPAGRRRTNVEQQALDRIEAGNSVRKPRRSRINLNGM